MLWLVLLWRDLADGAGVAHTPTNIVRREKQVGFVVRKRAMCYIFCHGVIFA